MKERELELNWESQLKVKTVLKSKKKKNPIFKPKTNSLLMIILLLFLC